MLLQTSEKRLNFHLFGPKRPSYSSFSLPKKTGGTRRIDVPPAVVASWQRILAALLRDAFRPKLGTHGFCLERSIVTGASFHTQRREVLNIDLKNFFGSIHFGRIRGVFQKHPFNLNSSVAAILAQLCCCDQHLPQGAPTSPIVTNWVCRRLDSELGKLAGRSGCNYTRYADDITFTPRGSKLLPPTIVQRMSELPIGPSDSIVKIIEDNGFTINLEKVYVRGRQERQQVTGLVVNQRVNVPRKFVLSLRGALSNWKRHGYGAANEAWKTDYDTRIRSGSKQPELREVVRGRLAFLKQVRGDGDRVYARYALDFSRLIHRDFGALPKAVLLQPTGSMLKWKDLLPLGVSIVTVEGSSGEIRQGTATHISGLGMITCFHVVKEAVDDPHAKIDVFSSFDGRTYPATIRAIAPAHDLAQLETAAPTSACFGLSCSPPSVHEQAQIAGFPDWTKHGQPPRVVSGEILDVRKLPLPDGMAILTNAEVRQGMSGGAVWNERGELIGILRADESQPIVPKGAVPIAYLAELASAKK